MNSLVAELSGPLAITMARVLLHFLWQGTVLAAALALALRVLRNAPARERHTLACGTLTLMAAAPVMTFLTLTLTPISFLTAEAVENTPLRQAPQLAVSTAPSVLRQNGLVWITWAWLVGVLVFGIRLAGGWWQVRRLATCLSNPAPQSWQDRCQTLAQTLGVSRPVRLRESARVQGPLVIGWLRPVILLPIGLLQTFPGTQIEALLLHELAHVRGHDYLINLLQRVAETVLFYHPAVWWVSEQIRREREHRCDDLVRGVQGEGRSLASALVTLAEQVHISDGWQLAATDGSMSHRVKRLLHGDPNPSSPLRGLGRWILALTLGALLVGVTVVAAPTLLAPRLYVATARIRVDTAPNSQGNPAPYDPYWLTTFLESVKCEANLQTLIDAYELKSRWGLGREGCIERLRSRIRVSQYRGTAVIEIVAASADPAEAKNLANELASLVNNRAWDDRRNRSQEAANSYERRVEYLAELLKATGEQVAIEATDRLNNPGKYHGFPPEISINRMRLEVLKSLVTEEIRQKTLSSLVPTSAPEMRIELIDSAFVPVRKMRWTAP